MIKSKSLIIYEPDFSNFHDLPPFISGTFQMMYNGIGKFSITLPLTNSNNEIMKKKSMIINKDNLDSGFIIYKRQLDTSRGILTVNGYTANQMLNDRAIGLFYNRRTDWEDFFYLIVNDSLRGLPVVCNKPIGLKPVSTGTITPEQAGSVPGYFNGGQLGSRIVDYFRTFGWGNKMTWMPEQKKFMFTIYVGRDLTKDIYFSQEQGTARNLIINEDSSLFKNAFYIAGELRRNGTFMLSTIENIGNAQGIERQEMWVDELITNDDGDEYSLRSAMKSRLYEEANRHLAAENFAVDIDASEYGKLYQLGDTVACVSTTYGVQFNKNITGIQYTLDGTGTKTQLILGEPNKTIVDKIKRGV